MYVDFLCDSFAECARDAWYICTRQLTKPSAVDTNNGSCMASDARWTDQGCGEGLVGQHVWGMCRIGNGMFVDAVITDASS